MYPDLFAENHHTGIKIVYPDFCDGELLLYPRFFDAETADHYMRKLTENLRWRQDTITLYGRTHKVPRLTAWYGDAGVRYSYSNIDLRALEWTAELAIIRDKIEKSCECSFNSVLANRYRDGSDGVAWHSDDERELGSDPVIASLTFGEQRTFQLKHKHHAQHRHSLVLPHGSLLVMAGPIQSNWLHRIPRTSRSVKERINLTFRMVH